MFFCSFITLVTRHVPSSGIKRVVSSRVFRSDYESSLKNFLARSLRILRESQINMREMSFLTLASIISFNWYVILSVTNLQKKAFDSHLMQQVGTKKFELTKKNYKGKV